VGSLTSHNGRSEGPPYARAIALAERQWGVVAFRQLRALGVSASAVEHWRRQRRLTQLHLGVYAVGHGQLRDEGRWLAAVFACGEGAALSHHDAAALWGIRATSSPVIHVSARRSRHHHPGIRVHRPRSLTRSDIVIVNGVPVTSIGRTLLDLAGVLAAGDLERAVARALRRPDFDEGHLAEVIARANGHRGAGKLKRLVATGPRLSRSQLETRMLAFVRRHGLPVPETNVRMTFGGGESWELDVLWRRQRVSVELDGWRYHDDRASFERDRERLLVLTANGYTHLQVTWRQLHDHPERLLATLRQALGLSHHP
jgi:very-short-patch-repair endonuclease